MMLWLVRVFYSVSLFFHELLSLETYALQFWKFFLEIFI